MKKTFLFILTVLFVATACEKDKSFTIKGNLPDDDNDGKMVYLQELRLDGSGEISLDSALIQNKAFEFKGLADSVCVRFITVVDPTGNIENMSAIIVEPGTINITIDTVTTITGSPMNDRYRELIRQDKLVDDRQDELRDSYEGRVTLQNITPEFTADVKKKYKELLADKGKIRFEYLRENMQNPVGEFFFHSFLMTLEPNQVIELISLSRPSFQSNEMIQNIKEQAEMLGSMNMRDPLDE